MFLGSQREGVPLMMGCVEAGGLYGEEVADPSAGQWLWGESTVVKMGTAMWEVNEVSLFPH